jgi:hypothetical protein
MLPLDAPAVLSISPIQIRAMVPERRQEAHAQRMVRAVHLDRVKASRTDAFRRSRIARGQGLQHLHAQLIDRPAARKDLQRDLGSGLVAAIHQRTVARPETRVCPIVESAGR